MSRCRSTSTSIGSCCPRVVLVWVVALAAGGARCTAVAVHPDPCGNRGVRGRTAGLSVVLNASEGLDQSLVLGLSIKKLSLLSALRRAVPGRRQCHPAAQRSHPSLKYILGLAGDLRDRRDLGIPHGIQRLLRPHDASAARLLPSAAVYASAFDELGRRDGRRPDRARTRGGGDPLDGLPDRDRRDHAREALARPHPLRARGLQSSALAMLSTYRKSALLAPVDRRPRARLLPPAPGAQARAPWRRW